MKKGLIYIILIFSYLHNLDAQVYGGFDYFFYNDFPAIRGTIIHQGNNGGLSLISQGANNTTFGSGDIRFLTSYDNSSNSSTDAPTQIRLKIKYNGDIDFPFYKDFPAIRGTIRHNGNASGFSFYSQGANNSINGSGGFTFFTTYSNSSDVSTDASYRKSMEISPIGNVAIYGKLQAAEIKITTSPSTADFVFDKNYKLKGLSELKDFVNTNKHLPEIPSANEMGKKGINMGEFQIQLLQKIEELTLYTIQQNEKIQKLEEKIETLESASK